MKVLSARLSRLLARWSRQERIILAIIAGSTSAPFVLGFQDRFDLLGWLSGMAIGSGLTLLFVLLSRRRPAPSARKGTAPRLAGRSVSLRLFMGDDWENAVEYGKFRLHGYPRVGGKIGRRSHDGTEIFAWRVVSVRHDHDMRDGTKDRDTAKVLVREGLA